MPSDLSAFQERVTDTLNESQQYCFMTRAIELQQDAADRLELLLGDCTELKAAVVADGGALEFLVG